MLAVTTNDITGWEVQRVCGEVFGLTVRSRNAFSQAGAGFKSMLGGELKGMTKSLIDSRNEVMNRMFEEARLRGGNAVIGMRFDTSEMGPNWTEICAYGTAVVAVPVSEAAKHTAAALGYGQPGQPGPPPSGTPGGPPPGAAPGFPSGPGQQGFPAGPGQRGFPAGPGAQGFPAGPGQQGGYQPQGYGHPQPGQPQPGPPQPGQPQPGPPQPGQSGPSQPGPPQSGQPQPGPPQPGPPQSGPPQPGQSGPPQPGRYGR